MALMGADEAADANGLGMEALRAGDAQAAAAHFQRACEIAPEAREMWLNLAISIVHSSNCTSNRHAIVMAARRSSCDMRRPFRIIANPAANASDFCDGCCGRTPRDNVSQRRDCALRPPPGGRR